MTNKLVGASVWETELYEHLTSHIENERELLADYQQVAGGSDWPAFAYLASLILEDEKRHHRIFTELADSLRSDAEMRHVEPRIPPLYPRATHPEAIVEVTDRLLDREHRDAHELRRLAKQLRDAKDTTLWQLLVKLMEEDTAKHIHILEFVKDHAR